MSGEAPQQPIRSNRFITLCGRTFHNTDPQYFPSTIYRGRVLHFCTDSCSAAFQADPARFYVAHRRSAHKDRRRSQP